MAIREDDKEFHIEHNESNEISEAGGFKLIAEGST